MPLPNFLIIGATKAGTTSIHNYIGQHPEVFVCPRKETNYFAQNSALCLLEDTISNLEEYEEQFVDVKDEKAIGETSPAYLAVPDAPKLIHETIPDVKLIAILRDPAERAYSHFLMRRKQGKELRESFARCMEEEDIDPARSYWHRGLYGEQLERYYKLFKPEQILIILYEDFVSDQLGTIQQIFAFLDVDDSFKPDISKRYNANPPAEPLSDGMRKKLIEMYREDILKAQELIEKDLSDWLK